MTSPAVPTIPVRARVGKRVFNAPSYEDVSRAYRHAMETTGATCSGETGPLAPRCDLLDASGNSVGYVSQNGRVWLGSRDNWEANALVYDPRLEART